MESRASRTQVLRAGAGRRLPVRGGGELDTAVDGGDRPSAHAADRTRRGAGAADHAGTRGAVSGPGRTAATGDAVTWRRRLDRLRRRVPEVRVRMRPANRDAGRPGVLLRRRAENASPVTPRRLREI